MFPSAPTKIRPPRFIQRFLNAPGKATCCARNDRTAVTSVKETPRVQTKYIDFWM